LFEIASLRNYINLVRFSNFTLRNEVFKPPEKNWKRCPTCHSSGKVEEEQGLEVIYCEKCAKAAPTFGGLCPRCGGTGKLVSSLGGVTEAELEIAPPCPFCNGTGFKNGKFMKPPPFTGAECEICGGKGWYSAPRPPKLIDCPTCKGSGFVSE
jgi:DnaJ-class molecular chaperone